MTLRIPTPFKAGKFKKTLRRHYTGLLTRLDSLTQIRRSLRGLKEVSNGTRARFKIFDHKIRPKGKTAARVGKGPGQIMHERFGWMRVVCGPSPRRSRGDGSSRHPIMLD